MGIFEKVIDAVRGKLEKPESDLGRCREIVSAYSAILENGPVPGTVADERELPYPKQTIRQALLVLLKTTTDPQMRGNLKAGYVCLADWQQGVGPHRVGFDITKLDQTGDALSIATRIAATEESAKKWLAKADIEQKSLVSELREMGF
ncbi:MAG: hypothetical protein HY017_18590 [Betaproteobacteria bacterium]|nr:hypothetical protein [Betaproteobacteria bacterium]